MVCTIVAACAISAVVYGLGVWSETADVEVISGEVVSKVREQVSCEHSYQCRCHMVGSGKNRHQECDTCYDHPYDFDWVVKTNIGRWEIKRVNRQGTVEPPRWTEVKVGDPVSDTHSYVNYVKAAPDSLFHANKVAKFEALIPPYPSNIYDYYKVNRVISMGVPVPEIGKWNYETALMLRKLGPAKQANVVILFVNTADQSYLHALEGKWIGGKKNDIIVIVGSTAYPKIDWIAISSWTDRQLFKVQLRDELFAHGTIDRAKFLTSIEKTTMELYQRKSMKDFDYLKYQVEPPTWVLTLAILLGIMTSLGLSFYFYHHDPFSSGHSSYRRR